MELHKMSYQFVNNILIRYQSKKLILKNVTCISFRPSAISVNFIPANVLPFI
jgi:hypothetical protein